MSNLSNKYEINWVIGSIAPAGKRTVELKPFEFGIVDKDTNKTLDYGDLSGVEAYFAVGSPNNAQATDGQKINRHYNPLNTNVSFKSDDIGVVKNLRFLAPDKKDLKQVYYLGYNGLDTCQSLNFECGKNYKFHLNVRGQEVNNIFGRYEFNEVVSIDTPCCDASCGCVDGKLDCSVVIDSLIDRFKTDVLWVNRFFDVEKVMDCSPAETIPTKVNYTTYCLTLCDNGDALSLAAVQNKYPTLDIKVKERKAPYTTYEFTQLAATAAPAAFSSQDVLLKDCTTCPPAFTSVAGGFAYIVEIDNTNADLLPAAQLTAVQTIFATATYAKKENFGYGVSTYYVVSSAALTAPTGDARIVKSLGVTGPKCLQTTPITATWASCGSWYKISRDLCLTKQNEDCQTNPEELAEIVAFYAGQLDIVPASLVLDAASTDCLIRFNVSQYNNSLLVDGCDTYGFDGAKFDSLPSYKGFRWEVCPCEGWTVNGNGCPVPPVPTDKCCQCGLKFTTKEWEEIYPTATFDINQYQPKDPIDLVVTAYYEDGTPMHCGIDTPTFRKVKGAKYQALKGRDVIKQILITRNDRKEKFLNMTSQEALLFIEREGIQHGVKLDDYYYMVSISNNQTRYENHPLFGRRETISLYIHEKDVVLFENLKAHLAGLFPGAKVELLS